MVNFNKFALSSFFILCLSSSFTTAANLRNNGNGNNGNGNNGNNGNGSAPSKDDEILDFIVKFKSSNDHQKFKKNESANYNSKKHLDFVNSSVIRFRNAQAAKSFSRRNDVKYVERDVMLHALQTEQVPYGVTNVDALDIPDYNVGSNVKACIIDTGYGMGHEDLSSNTSLVTGFNPYSTGSWDVDGNSHGTHVAGTMTAIQGNGKGVVGVVRSGQMPLRIGKGLQDSGSGSTSNVLLAMKDCVTDGTANGGKVVVNMSLGSGSFTTSVDEYLKELDDAGTNVLFVAAAGNNGSSSYSYPASYDRGVMMSVAAVDSNNVKASFSQYNDQVDIAGPGVGVISTITQNSGITFSYASYSGTSMATPHVASVAALVWSHYPDKSVTELRRALECSAIMPAQYNGAAKNDDVGHGVVNAKAAYDLLASGDYSACDATNSPTPSPTPLTCSAGEQVVEVRVTTDNYPWETSWTLTNSCTNNIEASSPIGAYTQIGQTYSKTICVSSDAEYSFTIGDTYGDGICCWYGSGSYSVLVDGVEKLSGGAFGSTETKSFGACGGSPPTKSPTSSPTASPTVSNCSAGEREVRLDLLTDNYPGETTWELSNACTYEEIASGGPYASTGTGYSELVCVPENGSYSFTIFDSWGDGICCSYGLGSYSLHFGTEAVIIDGGAFGSSETTTFGSTCSDPPTATPTSSPTSSPSAAPTMCNDALGWYDSEGPTFTCDWYSQKSNCQYYGNQYANGGLTANDACCVCGGGNV